MRVIYPHENKLWHKNCFLFLRRFRNVT
jgi:hypothetical protein